LGVEQCGDGVDNDKDGLVDCADSDCLQKRPCIGPETCDDGVDNNGDSLIDCGDPDCWIHPTCVQHEICNDGIDNDGDGKADCDDRDCRTQPPCRAPEVCDDGIDNDHDGFVDFFDGDCTGMPNVQGPGGAPAQPGGTFIRGDVDGSGRLNLVDIVLLIQVVFGGEKPRLGCLEAMDSNADSEVDIADAIPPLLWILLDGPDLPPPFPGCGPGRGGCRETVPGCQ
jgi:hypothetical protein